MTFVDFVESLKTENSIKQTSCVHAKKPFRGLKAFYAVDQPQNTQGSILSLK